MNFIKIAFFVGTGFLFLAACASPHYITQDAAFIMLKTPTVKYADMGFIYESKEATKAEIYSNGQALMSLKISQKSVCLSTFECMSKQAFNEKILSAYYPADTIENIFKGGVLFGGEGVQKNRNGFTQKLTKKDKYAIEYSVFKGRIHFNDTINHITIKITKQ